MHSSKYPSGQPFTRDSEEHEYLAKKYEIRPKGSEPDNVTTTHTYKDDVSAKLGHDVYDIGLEIFMLCGRVEDFCVQDTFDGTCHFGGWNRLHLDEKGWWISADHCHADFVEKFKQGGFGRVY